MKDVIKWYPFGARIYIFEHQTGSFGLLPGLKELDIFQFP
jgi:hypothetical protein